MHKLLSAVNKIITDKHLDDIVYTNKSIHIDKTFVHDFGYNYFKTLPSPPLNSGNQTALEIKEVAKRTHNRSPEDIKLVMIVDKEPLDLFNVFLKSKNLEMPYEHFTALYKILENIVLDLKYSFNRPRPEQLAEILNIDINIMYTNTHSTPAYPSGHTAYGILAAHVLTDYYPQYMDNFFEIADKIGEARVIQGVHYPSDNKASAMLVDKVYKHIVKYNTKHERAHNV